MAVRTHVVKPGEKLRLNEIKTDEDGGLSKKEGEAKLEDLIVELQELQELLFASSSLGLLVVLQGIDTSGKEGAIRRIARGTNLHGTRVAAYKAPTPEELSHDFLWRIHKQT